MLPVLAEAARMLAEAEVARFEVLIAKSAVERENRMLKAGVWTDRLPRKIESIEEFFALFAS
jgi:hypothetical protein